MQAGQCPQLALKGKGQVITGKGFEIERYTRARKREAQDKMTNSDLNM